MKLRFPVTVPSHALPEPPTSHYRYSPPSPEDQDLASSTPIDRATRNTSHLRDARRAAKKVLNASNPNLRSSVVLPKVHWMALYILGRGSKSKGIQSLLEEYILQNGFPKVPRPTISGPQSHLDPEKVERALALQKRIDTELRQQRAAKSAGLSYRERMPRDKKPKVTA